MDRHPSLGWAPDPTKAVARSSLPVHSLDTIGGTSLIDLSFLTGKAGVRLYGKAEYQNPGGSVKDRPALSMILDAEQRGYLVRAAGASGARILDATSGNTGIALAMIGSALGYGVTLCLPENASPERRKILAAYGAEVVLTDPLEGSDGAILEARRLANTKGDHYVYLDQYGNDANWGAHYRTTGPEILKQTAGAITHFVTGLGTSGTFVGVGRFLAESAPQVQLVSMEPDSPFHGLEGLKHMDSAIVPPIYDDRLAHRRLSVATERAHDMVRRLGREAGLLVGISAGGNLCAALDVASELEEGVLVTMLCDGADKYLSDRLWEVGSSQKE